MVLELQELIKAPWASSTGEVQSPGKPELGKEKEALGQVCFSDLFLTRANLSFYLLPICFYSTLHMPFVNSKVSPQNPTGTLAGFGQWPILGMLARARLLSPAQIWSSFLHSYLSGLRVGHMVRARTFFMGSGMEKVGQGMGRNRIYKELLRQLPVPQNLTSYYI